MVKTIQMNHLSSRKGRGDPRSFDSTLKFEAKLRYNVHKWRINRVYTGQFYENRKKWLIGN